jgi:hypothetical protein
MKMNYKKSLKLVTLLVTALLIATASAETYNYLFLNASIGVEGLPLTWVQGSDGLTTSITGATCSLSGLQGPAGGTKTYTEAVNITASANTIFNLQAASVTGSTSEMSSIIVKVYNASANLEGTLTVWDGSSTGSPVNGLSITSGETWRFQWEISWADGATGSVSVQLKVEIPIT